SDHMLLDHFPALPDAGLRFPLPRGLALRREDVDWMTWLHPLALPGSDRVLESARGKACVMLLRDTRLPAGSLVLGAHSPPAFEIERRHQAWRWWDSGSLRVVVDEQRRELGKSLTPEWLEKRCSEAGQELAGEVLDTQRERLTRLYRDCERVAATRLREAMEAARSRMRAALDEELARLRALRQVNPLVPESEITELLARREALNQAYTGAEPRPVALRLLVVTH